MFYICYFKCIFYTCSFKYRYANTTLQYALRGIWILTLKWRSYFQHFSWVWKTPQTFGSSAIYIKLCSKNVPSFFNKKKFKLRPCISIRVNEAVLKIQCQLTSCTKHFRIIKIIIIIKLHAINTWRIDYGVA